MAWMSYIISINILKAPQKSYWSNIPMNFIIKGKSNRKPSFTLKFVVQFSTENMVLKQHRV